MTISLSLYIYIYMYMCVYVCARARAYVRAYVRVIIKCVRVHACVMYVCQTPVVLEFCLIAFDDEAPLQEIWKCRVLLHYQYSQLLSDSE